MRTYSFYDLCSGIGGFRLGLESTGRFKCCFSCEVDAKACLTYKANFSDDPVGDVTKLDPSSLPDADVVCAGFPCQAFSMIGRRRGFDDARGTIFFHVARIAKAIEPRVLFLENVRGLLSHDRGKTFAVIRRTIEEMGYKLFHKLITASDHGIPQKRTRIYMVALREPLADFEWPSPVPLTSTVGDLLETEPVDASFFLSGKYLACLERHAAKQRALGRGFGYQILDSSGLANTLVTGGSGRERNLVVDNKPPMGFVPDRNDKHIRNLSPREFARIQGFPDDFEIPVSKTNAYKQFGNSVAVPVITAIGERIALALDKEEYKASL